MDGERYSTGTVRSCICILTHTRGSAACLPASDVASWQTVPPQLTKALNHMGLKHPAVPPASVVFVVQSGSAMYGLATASSDVDYVVIHLGSPAAMLSSRPPPARIEAHTAGVQ